MKSEIHTNWQINMLGSLIKKMEYIQSELSIDCRNKVENFFGDNYKETYEFLEKEIKRINDFANELNK